MNRAAPAPGVAASRAAVAFVMAFAGFFVPVLVHRMASAKLLAAWSFPDVAP